MPGCLSASTGKHAVTFLSGARTKETKTLRYENMPRMNPGLGQGKIKWLQMKQTNPVCLPPPEHAGEYPILRRLQYSLIQSYLVTCKMGKAQKPSNPELLNLVPKFPSEPLRAPPVGLLKIPPERSQSVTSGVSGIMWHAIAPHNVFSWSFLLDPTGLAHWHVALQDFEVGGIEFQCLGWVPLLLQNPAAPG